MFNSNSSKFNIFSESDCIGHWKYSKHEKLKRLLVVRQVTYLNVGKNLHKSFLFCFTCKFLGFLIPTNVGRLFKKIELAESIRYASGDPIESWLNALLCLDVANYVPNITRLDAIVTMSLAVKLLNSWTFSYSHSVFLLVAYPLLASVISTT